MFNFRTWKTYTFWIVIALTFYAGAVIGDAGKQATTAQPAVQTRTITVPDTADLAKLDALDKQIFGLSAQIVSLQGQTLSLAGDAVQGLGNGTASAAELNAMATQVNSNKSQIDDLNNQVSALVSQRTALLASIH